MIPLPIITFLKNNWLAILIAMLVGGLAIYIHLITTERDGAIKDLNNLKATYNAQVIENDKKFNDATTNQKKTEEVAKQQITDLKIDRGTLQSAIKGYFNETKHISIKPSVVSNVGIVLPSATSGSTTEIANSTEGLTTGESISGSTCTGLETKINDLTDALILETIDYNRARSILDQHCLQIGCTE